MLEMLDWKLTVLLLIGYLLGSINTSIIVGKLWRGVDVRDHGSKNAGATNTLRVLGKRAGGITLAGDVLKAVIGIVIARLWYPNYMMAIYVTGAGAILGHSFPLYHGFKGGKGVIVSLIFAAAACWQVGAAGAVIGISFIAITRYVSFGVMVAAIVMLCAAIIGAATSTFCNGEYVIFMAFIAILIFYRHRTNIERLIKGTESKIGEKKVD